MSRQHLRTAPQVITKIRKITGAHKCESPLCKFTTQGPEPRAMSMSRSSTTTTNADLCPQPHPKLRLHLHQERLSHHNDSPSAPLAACLFSPTPLLRCAIRIPPPRAPPSAAAPTRRRLAPTIPSYCGQARHGCGRFRPGSGRAACWIENLPSL
jgi:hypothetical protein